MTVIDNVEIYKESFREEAREICLELESALLELNLNPHEMDLVGRVFRALHTLKGSGAMFGFEMLASFTHDLENAYDEVRNGRLAITAELVNLTLRALDQIRGMLEESGEDDTASREQILHSLVQLTGSAATAKTRHCAAAKASGDGERPTRAWCISFVPGPEFMRFGANPLLLLRELRELGGLSVRATMDALPPLESMDPERCYICWDLVLETSADLEAIRDVFIFAEGACELAITPLESAELEAPVRSCTQAALPCLPGEARAPASSQRHHDGSDLMSTLRVHASKLDRFVDLVGELVTVQARLNAIASRSEDAEISQVSEEVERLTASLRESSMNIRMVPIRATFERFRRLVHDLALELGKDVELRIEGAETELDKTVVEQLGDPLLHLIRNSMDHGVETPACRVSAGKQRRARIHLSARYSGASVLISVSDDGAGIKPEAVRARAIEMGLISPAAAPTQSEIFALIFQPGFSTARKVTDVSGRGVGMDVVKQRVESLRGVIEIQSEPGKGTCVTLRLPLTLAIIDGLLVTVGGGSFVLPLASTLECIELSRDDVARADGKHVVNVRGEIIPYIRLREYFSVAGEVPSPEQIMVVDTAEGRFGFVVDKVLGNCQTVIKNLGRLYRHVQTVSGATILGNGEVALILDPERLAQDAVRNAVLRSRGHPGQASRQGDRARDGTAAMHA
jgi:two-component system chemotaxis sensor kinase CheA